MKLLVLNATVVRSLLSPRRCIELMRTAMALVARGATLQPLRQMCRHPSGRGGIGMMQGYTARPEWLGLKVMTGFASNVGTAFATHQGFVLLFEVEHGAPVAILDAREITAIRTAAATAVATDVLANPDSCVLALCGYGEQARAHLEALSEVRRFERVVVWGRDPLKAQAFAAAQGERLGLAVSAVPSPQAAAVAADVICTTTAAAEPFLKGAWLRPGQHLNAVGSSIPATAEVDEDAVARCRYFVDFRESALELAGDFRRARAAGLVSDAHILGSIGDVLEGKIVGRRDRADLTFFKSLGMISQDLVAADFVYCAAIEQGAGQVIDW